MTILSNRTNYLLIGCKETHAKVELRQAVIRLNAPLDSMKLKLKFWREFLFDFLDCKFIISDKALVRKQIEPKLCARKKWCSKKKICYVIGPKTRPFIRISDIYFFELSI